MAKLFRLVNYYNLPSNMVVSVQGKIQNHTSKAAIFIWEHDVKNESIERWCIFRPTLQHLSTFYEPVSTTTWMDGSNLGVNTHEPSLCPLYIFVTICTVQYRLFNWLASGGFTGSSLNVHGNRHGFRPKILQINPLNWTTWTFHIPNCLGFWDLWPPFRQNDPKVLLWG